MDPTADGIHPDPRMEEMIRLGFQIHQDPQTYASEFVGNDLTCGKLPPSMPASGIKHSRSSVSAATFPQYRRRDDRLVSLEDRIGGCFKRSMNGTPPPYDHPVMLALDAYLNWLSNGFAMGRPAGVARAERTRRRRRVSPSRSSMSTVAKTSTTLQCAPCHGLDGHGH